jgi:hypothetical protein
VVALYCKHITYISNLESYGLEYGKKLYDVLYSNICMHIYYLERFSHITKDVLCIRLLFSILNNDLDYPEEYADFIEKNCPILRPIIKYSFEPPNSKFLQYINKIGFMDGYSLQSLYTNSNKYYQKIKHKYEFIPQVGILDFNLLDKVYITKN